MANHAAARCRTAAGGRYLTGLEARWSVFARLQSDFCAASSSMAFLAIRPTALPAHRAPCPAASARVPRRSAVIDVRADSQAADGEGALRRAAARLAAAGLAAVLTLTPPVMAAPREAAAPLPPLPARLDIPYEQGGKARFEPMAYTGRCAL